MRFLTPLLCVFVAAPSVLALTPQQIISTLRDLESQANTIGPKFGTLSDQSTSQDVSDSMTAFEKYTEDYTQFSKDVVGGTTQGQMLDQSTASALDDAATQHSKALSTFAVAVVGGLRVIYDRGRHDLYQKGCVDGVDIGFQAIDLFTALGLKFSTTLVTVGLDGLLIVTGLALQKPSAVECFAPILPPILPRGI
ncbi:hypothetical protein B0H19DRAFT_1252337 [Mycena capillaripes]|nr:hypothetical protein B0H19DRAFT_1252337 [Mycena capillaripes]